jgi:hypothetical protein
VVRPTPRGALPYTADNVADLLPPARVVPAAADRIRFDHRQLIIPE